MILAPGSFTFEVKENSHAARPADRDSMTLVVSCRPGSRQFDGACASLSRLSPRTRNVRQLHCGRGGPIISPGQAVEPPKQAIHAQKGFERS